MRILLWPFYGQQDKQRSLFSLDTDSGFKLMEFLCEKLKDEHDVCVVAPYPALCKHYVSLGVDVRYTAMPLDNYTRRYCWDTDFIQYVARGVDLAIVQHDYMSIPLRALAKCHILMEGGMLPETAWTGELFAAAWRAADLVFCNSEYIQNRITSFARAAVWPLAYDERQFLDPQQLRDVDIVFPARCSATNYSNHTAFVKQMDGMNVVMTDPTLYGAAVIPRAWHRPALPREQYVELLYRSKVVVGFSTSGYAGYAFQEAIRAGCTPVALGTPGYRELLGDDWPYYCNLENVRRVVDRALADLRPCPKKVCGNSYQATWPKVQSYVDSLGGR